MDAFVPRIRQLKAYSYIRFSTKKQLSGHSLERQIERAQRYAVAHELDLDTSTYRDLGISAFDRSNVERGALAQFLKAVRDGSIPRGSYLLIESFDRLSRSDVLTALELFISLINSGITIVTLEKDDAPEIWNRETAMRTDKLMLTIIIMSRAYEESVRKSDLLTKKWELKKQNVVKGEFLTSECPRWLKPLPDKSGFEVIESKAESVRRVFEHRLAGHGVVSIVRKANLEGWEMVGNGDTWHLSTVKRLLVNRAVLGEYQPKKYVKRKERINDGLPVPGYYPAIVNRQVFNDVQALLLRNKSFPNKKSLDCKNIWQGLLTCECGGTFTKKNKASVKQPHYALYYCSNRQLGKTKCPSIPAKVLDEDLVLWLDLELSHVLSRIDDDPNALMHLENECIVLDQQCQNLAQAIAKSGPLDALVSDLSKLESQKKAAITKYEERLVYEKASKVDTAMLDRFKQLVSDSKESVEARMQLRNLLLRFVDGGTVYHSHNEISIGFRNGSGSGGFAIK
jgi:DNA invertase Pin-like site-specific DNA recombinase